MDDAQTDDVAPLSREARLKRAYLRRRDQHVYETTGERLADLELLLFITEAERDEARDLFSGMVTLFGPRGRELEEVRVNWPWLKV